MYFHIHDVLETFAPDIIFGTQFIETFYAHSHNETITEFICGFTNGTTEFHYIWSFIKLFALCESQVHV